MGESMANYSAGSITDMVSGAMPEITTAISGNLANFFILSKLEVQNYTGQTIASAGFDEKFVPVLYELTRGKALAFSAGVGVDFDYSLGEFSVKKGAGTADVTLLESSLKNAEQHMKELGKASKWGKTV